MADTGECHIRKKKAILVYLCLTPFPVSGTRTPFRFMAAGEFQRTRLIQID